MFRAAAWGRAQPPGLGHNAFFVQASQRSSIHVTDHFREDPERRDSLSQGL